MIKNLSVRAKVSGIIALVVVVVVLFQVLWFPARQIELLTQAVELKALAVARLVANDVRTGLDFDDVAGVRTTLEDAGRDPDVLYAVLYRHDGSVFVAHDPTARTTAIRPQELTVMQTTREQGEVRIAFPVGSKGGATGTLLVGFGTERVKAEASEIRMTTFASGAALLAMGWLVAFATGTLLGRRLDALRDVAARVATGDLQAMVPPDDSADELGALTASFRTMLATLRDLEDHVRDVAAGDLSQTTNHPGDLAAAFNTMIVAQRGLVTRIAETAVQLNTAAAQFLANAQQQQQGATEQSVAVEETRHRAQGLHAGADQIARSASDVLLNAERAQQNSAVVTERIAALARHTQRIAEILEVIKGIASKTDLLALNAALEGTKAGEAGRGFSLVAAQMQRLAENVVRSVADIKELTGNVGEATQATVAATEQSLRLAADTTRSARQIGEMSTEQRHASEQVTNAMRDVAAVAGQTASGSKDIVASASDLIMLSGRLQELVGSFHVSESGRRAR